MRRRNFLKTAAVVGAALTVQPAIDKVNAGNSAIMVKVPFNVNDNGRLPYRVLGSGKAAFDVSVLGFL